MARFFFDVSSGNKLTKDESGAEFSTLSDVRAAALSIIASVARDEMPEDGSRTFVVQVRDAANDIVVKVALYARADGKV